MDANFEHALENVLQHEGGWADHPQDPGGATMRGVTLKVFREFYGEEMTKSDLREISFDQLGHIYKTGYWDKVWGDRLPSGIDDCAFDAAVNSGVRRSVRW
ncbi:MAG: hypothetical protein OQK04_06795 [Kangiellaceae bacterium]|nr:hypothetical protein [Kangiellaceae bacterium]